MSDKNLSLTQNVERLKRYTFLEQSVMRTLAGWLPGAPEWEVKNEIGLHIWEDAGACERLRVRLREMRTHHPDDPAGGRPLRPAHDRDRAERHAGEATQHRAFRGHPRRCGRRHQLRLERRELPHPLGQEVDAGDAGASRSATTNA